MAQKSWHTIIHTGPFGIVTVGGGWSREIALSIVTTELGGIEPTEFEHKITTYEDNN